jgi:hypothetical protein
MNAVEFGLIDDIAFLRGVDLEAIHSLRIHLYSLTDRLCTGESY